MPVITNRFWPFVVIALCIMMPALPASAAPARGLVTTARPVAVHTLPLRRARAFHAVTVPALRYAGAPALLPFAARRSPVPIRVLPLVPGPQPVVRYSALLPALGFAALAAPLQAAPCAVGASRQVLVETLPSEPFTARDCGRRSFDVDERGLPPTSLVAGHNKNALYGRAYSPSAYDLH